MAYWIRYERAERQKKRGGLKPDADFNISQRIMLRPMDIAFCLKAASVGIAYFCLALFLFKYLFSA